MSSRSRIVAHAIACALVLTACDCRGSAATPDRLRAIAPAEPPPKVAQTKVDPLQPPPRDAPEQTEQVSAPIEATPPAPVPPPGPFDPSLLTGTWSGTYLYAGARGSSSSVAFFADLAFEGARLSGSIVEPNTFGDESSGELKASLAGQIDDDGIVRFTKTYDGSGGVHHAVVYVGRLDVAAQRIEGTWSIDGSSGRFVMMRHHPMPQLARR
jgi:hypothetical protein